MVLSREITTRIREVLEQHPEGLSITDLVRSVDINRNTAGRYLENLLLSGQVEMRRFGMAKMYTLTKRLPVSSVLSMSSELVMQLDFSLRVIYANDPLLTFLGVPAKDLFGKNIEFTQFSIVFEDVFIDLLDRFRRGLRGEEWYGELSCPVRQRFFFCRIAPNVSSEGSKGVSVLLEDISDKKRDEERIRKSEARLRSIFKVSPVGIGVVADRVFLEVNDRFCEMTGYSSAEMIGKSARILYPSEEAFSNAGTQYYNQIRRSGAGSIETQWIKKDGTVIDVLMNSTPLDSANISGGITFTALDITERKRSEQALRESEKRLVAAQRIARLGDVSLDIETGEVSWSQGMYDLLQYDRSVNVDSTLTTKIHHPEDRERLNRWLQEAISSGSDVLPPIEYRIIRKDGRALFVHTTGEIQRVGGKAVRAFVTLQDITEQKLAEKSLRESEEKYRYFVEQSLQGLTILQNGRPVFANSAMREISGYSSEEYLALGPEEMMATVHPDDRQRIADVMADRLQGKNIPAEHEFRILRKDGETRWVLTHGTLITYHGMPAIQIAYFDITSRRNAEDALRESEDRYRKLVEISPDAVLLHQNGKIIYVNPAAVRVLGARDSGEITGRRILEFIHPGYRDAVRDNIEKDLAGEQTPAIELQMLRTDGTPVMVEGRGVLTSIAGVPAVLVAVNDITERYRASLTLKESEERYRSLAEASQDFIFLIGRDDRVEYVNSYAAAARGLPADAIIGKKRSSLFSGELEQRQAQGLRRVFETGKAGHSEGAMEIAGTLRWFDHYLMPIRDADGTVTSVLGVSRDITDRKKAEDALHESEERYRRLLEQTFDAVAVHKDRKIAYLNERAAQILGAATPGDLMGRPIFDLIHPDSCRDLTERIRMMTDDPSRPAPVLREKFFRVDGTTVTVDVVALRIMDNGIPEIRVMFREVPLPDRT